MSDFTPYSEYQEIDASPMATLQHRYVADLESIRSKANYWDVYCTTNPDAPECKVYED